MNRTYRLFSAFLTTIFISSLLFFSGGFAYSSETVNVDDFLNTKGIIIKYKSSSETAKAKVREAQYFAKKLKKEIKSLNMDVFEISEDDNVKELVEWLSNSADVEYVQPDYPIYAYGMPNDPGFNAQWGLQNTGQNIAGVSGTPGIDINVVPLWDYTKGDKSVIVAVVDTGIDISHGDIKDNIFVNQGEIANDGIDNDKNGYIDDINGWNFYDGNNILFEPETSDWHGTGSAGIIAGSADNNFGISGVAPGIKILPVKYLGGTKGEASTSGAIMAIEYAKSLGASIINCSWGSTSYNRALADTIKKSPNVLFVCASGNDSLNTDTNPTYPACLGYSNVISVAAINNLGEEAGFSNYGSKIDVAAPGQNIYSTYPENSFAYFYGTSFAAPYVTGIAALLKSYRPSITSTEIKDSIKSSVKTLSSLSGIVNTGGVVDSFGALKHAENWTEISPSPELTPSQTPVPTQTPTPAQTPVPTETSTSSQTPVPSESSTAVPTPNYIKVGDVNEDGQVDSTDLTWMKRYLLKIITDFPVSDDLWAADVNGDGQIDSTDLTVMKRYLLHIIDSFPKEPTS